MAKRNQEVFQEVSETIRIVGQRHSNPMYTVPPVLSECEDYEKATAVGYIPEGASKEREKHSLMFKENEPYSFFVNPKHFGYMSTGYTTYFFFIIFLALIACMPFLITGGYLMSQNWQGSDCRPSEDTSNWRAIFGELRNQTAVATGDSQTAIHKITGTHLITFVKLSCFVQDQYPDCKQLRSLNCSINMTEKCNELTVKMFEREYASTLCHQSTLMKLSSANNLAFYITRSSINRDLILLISILASLAMISYFHYYHSLANVQLDLVYPSVDDCSVKIEGIPARCISYNDSITRSFESHGYKIAKIVLCYDLSEMNDLKAKFEAKNTEVALGIYEERLRGQVDREKTALIDQCNAEVAKIAKRIKLKEAQYDEGTAIDFVGVAYVSLNSVKDRIEVVNKFESKGLIHIISHLCSPDHKLTITDDVGNVHKLKVSAAPPSKDVVWGNQGWSTFSLFMRNIISKFASLILVIIDFFGVYAFEMLALGLFNSLRERYSEHKQEILHFAIEAFIATIIFCFDKIIEFILHKLADFEKPDTTTKKQLNTANKVWKVQWLTSGLVPLLISAHIYNFYGRDGLYSMINSLLLTFIVLTPIVSFLEKPSIYIRAVRRWWIRRKLENNQECHMTQYQANKQFMKANFIIWMHYAALLRYTSIAFFYMPMLPIASVYLIVFLVVMYAVDKLLLITLCNKTNMYTGYISKHLICEIELMPACFVFGLIVNRALVDLSLLRTVTVDWMYISTLALLIASYIIQMPRRIAALFKSANDADSAAANRNYFDIIRNNPIDYKMTNPATSELGRNQNVQLFFAANIQLDKLPLQNIVQQYVLGVLGFNTSNFTNLLKPKDMLIQELSDKEEKKDVAIKQGYLPLEDSPGSK